MCNAQGQDWDRTKYYIDLTHKSQHGFKKKRSTTSLSLTIQNIIAQALDEDSKAIMASIDLSAAFGMVNVIRSNY